MSASESDERTPQELGPTPRLGWRVVFGFAAWALLLPLILLGAAGTLEWPMGWAFLGTTVVFNVGSRLLLVCTNPALAAERANATKKENVKAWDRILGLPIVLVGPLALWVVAGLDQRFAWSTGVPLELQLAALVVVALGYSVATWALLANPFFSAVVRIQSDRGHTVATGGPYRWVRHPAYAGGIAAAPASALALGSLWALIPAGVMAALVVVRTMLEDRTLRAELIGYAEYARSVRYRLLPGVW